VLILLPPSEGKTTRARGSRLDLGKLSFPELRFARERVAEAVQEASGRPDAAAVLGVSPGLTAEIARNVALFDTPTLPALSCYCGVLYDALDRDSLDAAGRRRANRWIVISSALYGALRPGDPIAPYRLSMAVNLPDVGSLASFWRPLLAPVLAPASGRGIVVDARSGTYAASWPVPAELASRWVEVKVVGATHMAKHARGLVTRAICAAGIDPRRPGGLVEPLGAAMGPDFALSLEEPRRAGAPWTLSVTPPAGPVSGHRITL
jgi:cytoplasmic iron level regulating protein YaaA (DUF328/UPF0246 family)